MTDIQLPGLVISDVSVPMPVEFEAFPKIPRLNRDCVITEKIDGTNAQIIITADGQIAAGSRTRLITPGKQTDNHGFAGWVEANKEELLKLGPGRHFGEWWGQGIQRNYGLTEKRFSLFHTHGIEGLPTCVSVVPTLYEGPFNSITISAVLDGLRTDGSKAAPGFMKPEGIVVFHTASRGLFKVTVEKDAEHKGKQEE